MSNLSSKIIQSKVLGIVQKIKDSKESFSSTSYLVSQGVDSLDMFDILVSIQANFGIDVDIESIEEEEWSTIDKIVQNIDLILAGNNE